MNALITRPTKSAKHRKHRVGSIPEPLEQRIAPAAVFWDGGGDGVNWTNADNWNNNLVPTGADDVTINPGGTVTITLSSGVQTVASLSMPGDDALSISGGSLALAGASVIHNLALGGSGALFANAALSLTGTGSLSGSATLGGAAVVTVPVGATLGITSGEPNLATELVNAGTIAHGNAYLDLIGAAAELRIVAGGLYESANTSSGFGFRANSSPAGVFVEAGGILRHASPNGASFDVVAGTPFSVQGGTLQNNGATGSFLNLNGIGTFTNAIFQPSVGTAIRFAGVNNTIVGSATGSGAGSVQVDSGTLSADANGATLNFPAGLFNWLNSGTLAGPGTFTNTGAIQITGGEPDLATELVNAGTIAHGNAFLDLIGTAAELRIVAGGLYESANTSSGFGFRANSSPAGVFVEAGGILRHASPNGASFDVVAGTPFTVQGGTLQNQSAAGGFLHLSGIGTFTNAIFQPGAGTAIRFTGVDNTIVGSATGSGAGSVQVDNGTLSADANGATLNFPGGLFNWLNSGTLAGPGTFTNTGTIQITGGDPNLTTKLVNAGTIQHGNAFLDLIGTDAELRIVAGGLYESANTSSGFGFRANSSPAGVFVEADGTLRHASPNGASFDVVAGTPFSVQGGTLQNQSAAGGLLNLNGIGTFTNAIFQPGTGTAIRFTGVSNTIIGSATGSGAGSVQVDNGTLSADATGATFNFPAGLFNWLNSGTLAGPGTFTNTGAIQITGGDPNLATELVNAGTILHGNAFLDLDGAAAELRIVAGGLYESANTSSGFGFRAFNAPDGVFLKAGGTLRHASPNGASFDVAAGTPFAVQGGTLQNSGAPGSSLNLNGIGTFTNAIFQPGAGTTIRFTGVSNTIVGITTGSGAGSVQVDNGTISADAAGATLNFPSGLFNWLNSGTLAGPGTFTNTGAIQITGGDPNLTTELVNAGTILHGNAFLDLDGAAAELRIVAGGLYESVNTSSGFGFRAINAPAGVFVEADGTLRHASPNGASFAVGSGTPFSNLGKVEATGGALSFSTSPAQIVGGGGTPTLSAGAWEVANGATLNLGITGLQTNAAEITVRGTGSFTGLGVLTTNSGSLSLLEGADLTTAQAFTNSGTLTLSAGAVLTAASFTQTAAGRVAFEIGGATVAQLGRVATAGSATLAGTASVAVANGFAPQAGQNFALMSFASRNAAFASVFGLNVGHAQLFEAVNSATNFSLNSLVNASDLAVETVSTPGPVAAGNDVSFSYTVRNNGAFVTPVAAWSDTIYLSKDGLLDATDIVLTRITHNGAVAAGDTYTVNVNVPLVGALPADYQIIVVADALGRVADTDRSDNTLASTGAFTLSIPTLTPGVAFNGTIASGRDQYFQITLPAGQAPTFTFTGAVNGQAEIYESINAVPTRANFFESAFVPSSTVQRIVGDTTSAATYYVLVHGRENAGAGQSFSLVVQGAGFDLIGTSVADGPAIGNVTTSLSGTLLTPGTTFTLVSGGTTREATATYFRDSRNVDATFDLTGLAPGSYNIVADNGGSTDTLTNAFTVSANGTAGALNFSISAPRYIRAPFTGVAATITYENTGDTDLAAPLFNVIAENALMRLADEPRFLAGTFIQDSGRTLGVFELLGVSGGLAGVLSPGERASIEVIFQPVNSAALALVNFEVVVAGESGETVDFSLLKDDLQPAGVSNEAWDAVFANFTAEVGTTVASYRALLVDNANYLGQFGPVSPAVTRLLDFELDQAGVLGAIADRYELGIYGRGSSESAAGPRAFIADNGDVTLKDSGSERIFSRNADGSYTPTGVDFGKLTRSFTGALTLDEGNGSRVVFRASDGRVDFFEGPNGTRITATWNANGQLTALTDSLNGDTTSYTYNAQGRMISDTDPVGRVTTYGYDASGEHLTSITAGGLTTTFTYVTGQGAQREHALASTTGPDGVTTFFEYDARGRLTKITTGTGPQAISETFAYDSAGRITATDAAGNTTTSYHVAQGALARTIDALGNFASVQFDAQGRYVSSIDATGAKTSLSLDRAGLADVITSTGRTKTDIEIGGPFRNLQSVTSAGGDITRLSYDAKGNLTGTTFTDGSTLRYEYDSAGRLTATTDANGGRTGFTYNASGLVELRTLPDGSTVSYTYDAHRNLLTATDAEGTTTHTYDTADRLTSIAYPNGKTVTTTYDAQGRRSTVSDGSYTVKYSYDALGRLDTLRDGGDALLVDYGYDALGRLTSETRGNGATTTYGYDALNRPTNITHRDAGNVVTGFFDYTYDTNDRVKTVTDANGTTTYGYDLDGQLTSVVLPGGRTIIYAYDVEGNRVTVSDNGTDTNYTTNAADQYSAAGAETLTYDSAGRIITSTVGGVTTSYTYDAAGRLASIVAPGSVITYDYDALGNRIGRVENGVRTDFANDPSGLGIVFGEYSGGTATAHYATGLGIAARIDGASTVAFYHFDAGGNTALLSGAGGLATATYAYLPFGEIVAQTGASAQPFTYGGSAGIIDEVGDLYSMRARFYDAGLGRFAARDPIGFGGGDTNLYRYVGNDPVNSSDPSGLQPLLGGIPSTGNLITSVGNSYFPVRGFIPRGAIGDVGLVLSGTAGGIPSATNVINPVTHGALATELATSTNLSRVANSTLNAVSNPGANLPAVYDAEFAAQQLLGKAQPQQLTKGGNLLNKAINLPKGAIKALAPVAKLVNKLIPPPVQAALAVKDLYDIEKSAYDYLKDAGTYGKFNPDEKNFSPEFYKDNADNALLNDLILLGMKDRGLSKPEATLEALAFLKKLNNDYIRDQQNAGGGSTGTTNKTTTQVVRPSDPNNVIGPAGAGADPVPAVIGPGQFRFDGFVEDGGNYAYKIEFENQPSASAPAQVVVVTQTLDTDLDFSTFQFKSFGWGEFLVPVPEGANGTSFHNISDLALSALGVLVKIDADLDTTTGLLTVTYTSLDPATNDVPFDPFAGFLPANDATGRGDGFLTYSIAPKAGLPNATDFTGIASIVFDTEDAIATPTVTNTLDIIAPTSQVTPFDFATTSRSTFTVRWTGADDAVGSGLAGITLSFTANDGPLQTATVANADGGFRFTGEIGHTYKFFSQAVDNVGNTEALAMLPDAQITVVAPTFLDVGKKLTLTDDDGDRYTIKFNGPGTAKVAILDPDGDGNGPIDFLVADSSTTKSKLSVTVKKNKNGGDGIVSIGDFNVNGSLNSFTAKQSDLTVNGITATGTVKSIAVRDILRPDAILADPLVQLGGTNVDKTKLTARTIADGFTLTTPGILTSLIAASIGDGEINAQSLGKLTTTVGAMNADLAIAGNIGPITVKLGANPGTWDAASFGSVTLGNTLNADITSANAIGPVLIKAGALNGDLDATGKITSVTAKGGAITSQITATAIGPVSVIGEDFSGAIVSTANTTILGKTKALTSLTITGGDLKGSVSLAANAGPITVKENAQTGNGGNISGPLVANSFGAITLIGGGFSGGVNGIFATGLAADLGKALAIASFSISGGDLTTDVRAFGGIGPISVKANKLGSGGNITDINITAAKIAALTVGKDLTDTFVLAGTNLGADDEPGGTGTDADTFAAATIGAVNIGGNVVASVIAAGLSNPDGIFKNNDDTLLGTTPKVTSTIASLIVKGTADAPSYFVSGKFIAKPKIENAIVPLPDPRFLVA